MSLPSSTSVADEFAAFEHGLAEARSTREAQAVRDRFLGRKNSVVSSWMQQIAAAPPDQKKLIGRYANDLKQQIEARWAEYENAAAAHARPAGAVDVTLPGRVPRLGHRHPLTVVRDRMEAIFTRMGFAIVEGPEIEDEWHCFDALNMPAEHPARDMQDTLYLGVPVPGGSGRPDDVRTMLRTHTSSIQIRYMESHQPPIRIVAPGRVYRRDDLDLTHSPAFGQVEALVVGEGISMAHLKGTLLAFVREWFSDTSRVRFRPSFFPYTEPSAEIDISCWQCDGAGCAMCKRTGWIELGGCGMVHPAVFEAVGYDAERYTGFAWGLGIERLAMLRHQVQDIRMFFENDLRFLEQFPYSAMKLLVSWVREFVDVAAPPEALAERLALRGFEVASIDRTGDDAVIDFEVTANRPDCLSVVGFAREIATAYDLPLVRRADAASAPPFAEIETGLSDSLTVAIDDTDLCPRYAAAVVDVTPTTTPAWMSRRLDASGVRPISPLVDITNYVLMELGQPMHAFDLARLGGAALRVRRARADESIATLDGVERRLDADMLVVADAGRAQAIAGVMGGAESEVSASTRAIALESAYLKPASVRRTSKRLGLKTEASSRFERGADIGAPVVAIRRAIALMAQIGAGRLRGAAIDLYPQPRGLHAVRLRRDRLALVLGLRVPDDDVVRILRSLGLTVSATPGGWDVVVPSFRVDLLREVDLVEEVGRHYGFDRLEPAFPVVTEAAPAPDPRVVRDQLARRVLTSAGLSEAITFGFIERRAAEPFAPGGDTSVLVPVANPLSAKFDTLRPSLLPGLLESVAHNRNRGRRDVGLFELGARFTVTGGENRALALAWTGSVGEHWSAAPRAVDFFDAKGIIERLCSAMSTAPAFDVVTLPYLVPGQSALVSIGGEAVGIVGQAAPAVVERAGAPRQDAVLVAELDLDRLERHRQATTGWVTPLSRHPFVVRDLSIAVPDSLPAEIIRGTIQTAGGGQPAPLVAVTFFDRYQGKGMPESTISLSIRLTFQAADRTLTDPEVQTSFDSILAAIVREHGAVQR